MNYSVYIDNTTLIATGYNVTNGTYYAHNYYTATNYTTYYYKIYANTSTESIEEIYHFTIDSEQIFVLPPMGVGLLAVAIIFILLFVGIVWYLIKKRKNEQLGI